MKSLFTLIVIAAISLGSIASNEKVEPIQVEIKPVIYSESQLQDYERILEIDSIQTSLKHEKDSLLSVFKCTAKSGIERPANSGY